MTVNLGCDRTLEFTGVYAHLAALAYARYQGKLKRSIERMNADMPNGDYPTVRATFDTAIRVAFDVWKTETLLLHEEQEEARGGDGGTA